jgi:hypothetical protein
VRSRAKVRLERQSRRKSAIGYPDAKEIGYTEDFERIDLVELVLSGEPNPEERLIGRETAEMFFGEKAPRRRQKPC